MISAMRDFSQGEHALRQGTWIPKGLAKNARDLDGQTLAIFGFGGIGHQMAIYARAFGMRVIYHARKEHHEAPEWAEYFGADCITEMLNQTDVLSVHVPLKEGTQNIIGEKEIRALKRGAVIVNTARGKVVDEEAMIRALEDGHVSDAFTLLNYC